MFTTYGADNYKSNEGLLVWYEQERVTSDSTTKVKVTRHATKNYSFIFMTKEAAASCVTAKRSQYTRTFADWSFSSGTVSEDTVTECKTEISSAVDDAGARTVSISVNETDTKYLSPTSGSDYVELPAAFFSTENNRNYDESVRSAKTTNGLSSYSPSKNLDVSQDLMILYAAEKQSAGWYIYHRYATMNFEYIGMTQAAAESCAAVKRSQYTRLYDYVESSESTISSRNKKKIGIGASISLRFNGHTWSVAVSVNETDSKASSSSATPATLFADENGRSYEGSSQLTLSSVVRDTPEEGATTVSATCTASISLPDKSLSDCAFEYRISDSVNWNTASVTWGDTTGTLTLPVTALTIYCRLTCDNYESDTITAT